MDLEWHSLVQANLSNITGRIIGAVGTLHQLKRCPSVRVCRVPWVLCLRLKSEGTKVVQNSEITKLQNLLRNARGHVKYIQY